MTQETTQQITGYTDVTHTTVQGKLCKSVYVNKTSCKILTFPMFFNHKLLKYELTSSHHN